MTNLTPEQLREAVELADGVYFDQYDHLVGMGSVTYIDDLQPRHIAALASQLISQVQQIALEEKQPWLWANIITELRKQGLEVDVSEFLLVACTEFLRGR